MSDNMKADAFSHEIVGTSRTFYRQQGLQVVIEGDRAYTDGQRVVIPAIDLSKKVDLRQQRITRGYVDHEAGHGRHTRLEAMVEVAGMKYAPTLTNAIEDVRIERLIIDEYPGAQKNLEAVCEAVNAIAIKHGKEQPDVFKDFKKIGAVAITWEGRRRLGYDVANNEECLNMLDPDVRRRVEKVCDLIPTLKSTDDVVKLAKTIDSEMSAEASEPPAPPGGGRKRAKGTGAESGPAMYMPEAADALSEEFSWKAAEGGGYRVWTWDKDWIFRREGTPINAIHERWQRGVQTSGEGRYGRDKDATSGNVNQMRRKLERALITKQNRGWKRNQEDGVLDSRRLIAALGGATNVNRQRDPVDDLDVAVTLVVDLSGSMHGEKLILARRSAIAYAEALEKVQIPFAIAGFTVNESSSDALDGKNPASMGGYRNYPLAIYIFKEFDESLKRAKGAIGAMAGEHIAMGNNADGDSLLQIYWNLLKPRREKRRAMIVFSDGHPAAHGGNQDQRLRDVVSYIEGEGVDLIGVGILSDAPKKYYKKHTVVRAIRDLGKESLQQLAALLIDPKFKVDNSELMSVAQKIGGR